MSAVAKLMAVMGLDAGQFKKEMDGATRKTQGFGASLGTIKRIMQVAFATQAVRAFINTTKEIEQFQNEKGITIVSDEDLARMKEATAQMELLGLTIKAKVVTTIANGVAGWRAFWTAMGAKSGGATWKEAWEQAGDTIAPKDNEAKVAAQKESQERTAALQKEIDRITEAQKSADQKLADEQKKLDQARADRARAATAHNKADFEEASKSEELQLLKIAKIQEEIAEKRKREAGYIAEIEARAAKELADAEYDALKDAQKDREDKERQAEQDFKTIQRAGEQAKSNTPLFARAPDALARIGGSLGPNPMAAMRREDAHARQRAMIQAIKDVELAIAMGGGGE